MSSSSSWWSSCAHELPHKMAQLIPSMRMLALLSTKGLGHPFSALSLLSHETHEKLLRTTLHPGHSWCRSSVSFLRRQGFV